MKFNRIIGKCDQNLILEAEDKLSSIFLELAMDYKTKSFGSKMGGDIFLYQMVAPLRQNCDARALEFAESFKSLTDQLDNKTITEEEYTLSIIELKNSYGKLLYTASTNGKEYFWYPPFILNKSKIGLRLVVGHEGHHSIHMHPARRGSRNRALWNISVDFKVNYIQIDDLKARGFYQPAEVFRKELGDFITLQEYCSFLKDPFNPPDKLSGWNPLHSLHQMLNPGYKNPYEGKVFYYAEPDLPKDMRKPEDIYSYLFNKIPKCKECGKLGVWKKPDDFKKIENEVKKMLQLPISSCNDH